MTNKHLLLFLLKCATYVTASINLPGLDAKLYNVPSNFRFKGQDSFHTNLDEKFTIFDTVSGVRDITFDFSERRALDTVIQELSGFFVPPETGEYQFYLDASMDATFQIGAGKSCVVEAYKSFSLKKILKTSDKEPLRAKLKKDRLYPIRIAQFVPKATENSARPFISLSCVSPSRTFINDIASYVKKAEIVSSFLSDEVTDKSFVKHCNSLAATGQGYQFRVLLSQGSKRPNLINDVNSPAFIDFGTVWNFENPAQIYGESINSRKFAIELSGLLKVKETGKFTLKVALKGGISIQVGEEGQENVQDAQILQLISREAPSQKSIELYLVAEKYYPVRIVLINKRARPFFQFELIREDKLCDVSGIWFHKRETNSLLSATLVQGDKLPSSNNNKNRKNSENAEIPPPKPQRSFATKPISVSDEVLGLDPIHENSLLISSKQGVGSTLSELPHVPREPILPTRKKIKGERAARNPRSATNPHTKPVRESVFQVTDNDADLENGEISEDVVLGRVYPLNGAASGRLDIPIQMDESSASKEDTYDSAERALMVEAMTGRVSEISSSVIYPSALSSTESSPSDAYPSFANFSHISVTLRGLPKITSVSTSLVSVISGSVTASHDSSSSETSTGVASRILRQRLSSRVPNASEVKNGLISAEARKSILTGVIRSSSWRSSLASTTEINRPTLGIDSDDPFRIDSHNSPLQPKGVLVSTRNQTHGISKELENDHTHAGLILNAEYCASLRREGANHNCYISPETIIEQGEFAEKDTSFFSRIYPTESILSHDCNRFATKPQNQSFVSSVYLDYCVSQTDIPIRASTSLACSKTSCGQDLRINDAQASISDICFSEEDGEATSLIAHPEKSHQLLDSEKNVINSMYFDNDYEDVARGSLMQATMAFEGSAKKLCSNIFALALAVMMIIFISEY